MALTVSPKTLDKICIVYIQILIHALLLGSFLIVFPWMRNEGGYSILTYTVCNVYAAFLYVNIMCNMYKVVTVDTSTSLQILPAVPPPGWNYCSICEANYPPRAYHCYICRKCILKRDHHCNVAGKCVGHFNYRYYLCLIAYSSLACHLVGITSCHYVWSILGEVSMWSVASYLFPLFMFAFGALDIYTTCMSFLSFMSWMFYIFTTGMLVWHSKHVLYNMTTYERRHDIYKYDLGSPENVRRVFGRNWKIAWISPFISSPLYEDGFKFDLEVPKSR
ncbi:hypothetical protein FSP39_005596 [Pinctada imbricata]|uniref:Palmitoyltransferase n=1 Tax=Pinctada imbricata TaxID=66713 RepID=A0AA88XL32_PINIB|nr:hypothetical protein FSP39_005596 [Pinctada imbricata]